MFTIFSRKKAFVTKLVISNKLKSVMVVPKKKFHCNCYILQYNDNSKKEKPFDCFGYELNDLHTYQWKTIWFCMKYFSRVSFFNWWWMIRTRLARSIFLKSCDQSSALNGNRKSKCQTINHQYSIIMHIFDNTWWN